MLGIFKSNHSEYADKLEINQLGFLKIQCNLNNQLLGQIDPDVDELGFGLLAPLFYI